MAGGKRAAEEAFVDLTQDSDDDAPLLPPASKKMGGTEGGTEGEQMRNHQAGGAQAPNTCRHLESRRVATESMVPVRLLECPPQLRGPHLAASARPVGRNNAPVLQRGPA